MQHDDQGCAIYPYSRTSVRSVQERQLRTRLFTWHIKTIAGESRPFRAAYRRRSQEDFTLFSRATWTLSYHSGNTSARIGQNVEVWSLDTTSVVIASAPTQRRCLYEVNDVLPPLTVVSQSCYWRWQVGVVCSSYVQAARSGSWTNRWSKAYDWNKP